MANYDISKKRWDGMWVALLEMLEMDADDFPGDVDPIKLSPAKVVVLWKLISDLALHQPSPPDVEMFRDGAPRFTHHLMYRENLLRSVVLTKDLELFRNRVPFFISVDPSAEEWRQEILGAAEKEWQKELDEAKAAAPKRTRDGSRI